MRAARIVRTASAVAALCALLAVGWAAAQTLTSASNTLSPERSNAGGADGLSSSGNQAATATGEVGFSTAASASYVLRAGSLEVRSRPGKASGLTAVSTAATSIRLSFSAPGYDGAAGALRSGSLYRVQVTTQSADLFSPLSAQVVVSTSAVNPGDAQSLPLTGLLPNSTYFLRLWTQDADGDVSPLSPGATVATLAPPATGAAFKGVFSTSVTVTWVALPSAPPDASSKTAEGYRLEASSTNFGALTPGGTVISSATPNVSLSTLTVSGLLVATTYYFRVAALGWDGSPNYTVAGSTLTLLTDVPPGAPALTSVLPTSVGLSWTPVHADLGYLVQGSTAADFTGVLYATSTADGTAGSISLTGLMTNTTFFFRVGSLWNDQTTVYAAAPSTSTLATAPPGLALQSLWVTSGTVTWVPLPSSPPDASSKTAEGYVLEASSTNFVGGVSVASRTPNVALSTLTLSGLAPNTTYWYRVGALDWSGAPDYSLLSKRSTLASIPNPGAPPITAVWVTSVTAAWDAGAPANPPWTHYHLQASSTNFQGGTVIVTSSTFNTGDTVPGLLDDTTYWLLVDALNGGGTPSRLVLGSTTTLAFAPASPAVTAVYPSSAALSWTPVNAQGYRVDASSTNFGALLPGGAVLSSATANGVGAGLIVSGLLPNTTYFFRVASLNWASALNYAGAGSVSTLAPAPAGSQFAAVFQTSVTLNWNALPAAPQASASEGYELDASTAADFSGTVYSSSTPNVSLATLTVSGLPADTTYFFRVGALNWASAASYAASGSTPTLAVAPGALALAAIYQTSATLTWSAVTGQGYELDAASDAGFTTIVAFSSTSAGAATSLSVFGLSSDTTYFFRAGSYNWARVPDFAVGSSTPTLAAPPGAPFFPDFLTFFTSSTVQWTAVTSQGYRLDASTAPDFSGTVISTITPNGAAVSLVDLPLNSATTYYFQLASLNWAGAADYVLVGSTMTQQSPKTWTNGALDNQWNTAGNWNPAGVPGPNDAVTINIAGSVDANTTAVFFSSLTIGVPAGGVAANLTLSTTVAGGGSVIVYGGAGLTMGTTQPIQITGNLALVSGSSLTHLANGAAAGNNAVQGVDLSVTGLFDLQAGATMTAAGLGFYRGNANQAGKGTDPGGGTSVNNTGGGGAGHGGAGSNGTGGSGGAAGDSRTNPTKLGSGGGGGRVGAGTGQIGGLGGGLFIVTAANMNLNGLVDVGGADGGSGGGDGGGGAGGTANLTATSFQGTGTVLARGGNGGATLGGGGGGGRVSIDVTGSGSVCGVTFDVSGGTGTSSSGGAGTVSSTTTLVAAAGFAGSVPSSTTIFWTWSAANGATGYQLFSSTGGSGESPVLSAQTSAYLSSGLLTNATAAFFVRALSCAGSADSAVYSLSTLTQPLSAAAPALPAVSSTSVTGAYNALPASPQTATSEGYEVDASTAPDFSGLVFSSRTLNVSLAGLAPQGLWPNTTYFARAAGLDWSGTPSSFTLLGSTATLSAPLSGGSFYAVWGTSVTASWTAAPPSPPAASSKTAEGYRLELSTATDFSGAVLSSATPSLALSTLTITGLLSETTYYGRVASLNWNGLPSYASLGYALTLDTTPPGGLSDLAAQAAASSTTLLLSWTASGNDGAAGCVGGGGRYQVDLSSDPLHVFSTSQYLLSVSTTFCPGQAQSLVVNALLPNTTYFARVVPVDSAGNVGPLSNGATAATLATPPVLLAPAFLQVNATSATLDWAALPLSPPAASSRSAEGFRLEASTTNFGAVSPGGVTLSSATPSVLQSTLTITALSANTTYYFRAASLNWVGVPDYTVLGSTITPVYTGVPPSNVAVAQVFSASVTLSWASVGSDFGYLVDASTAANFTGTVTSTQTGDGTATTLTEMGLFPNTTYFLRVGALWNTTTNYASAVSTPTWAPAPQGRAYAALYLTSATVSWTPLPASPPDASSKTAEGYQVDASTAADFSGAIFSSTTASVAVSALAVSGLSVDTTYFFRAATLNWSGAPNYAVLRGTSTLASAPGAPLLTAVFLTSAAAQWTAGSPAEPPGARYALEASSASFGAGTAIVSSNTANLSGTVFGLMPNTTYQLRVSAVNWNGIPAAAALGSTATLANAAAAATPPFPGVFETSATASWVALPTSPPDASSKTTEGYVLDASSTNFGALAPGGVVYSSASAGSVSSLSLGGLDRNTTYYFRLATLNWGSARDYAALGSTATLAPLVSGLQVYAVYETSAALNWLPLPASPQLSSAEGYELDASTAADFTGTILSSTSLGVSLSTLTVSGLAQDTTYFFRLGALNWALTSNPGGSVSSATLASPPVGVLVAPVYLTSAAVSWTAVAAQGYELDAASDAGFTSIVASSNTTSGGASALSVTGLSTDTTYYFRVGSINWNGQRRFAAAAAVSTLAQPPSAPFFPSFQTYFTSATVQWTAVTSQGYRLDASTAADFTGAIASSVTYNGASVSLIDLPLNSATTYYFRLASLNWSGALDYVTVGSTMTQQSPKTWTNGALDNQWNTAGNWSPPGVPGANDSVTIAIAGSVDANTTAVSFSSLTIGVPAGGVAANLTLSTTVVSGGSVIVYGGAGLTLGTTQLIQITGNVALVAGSTLSHVADGAVQADDVNLSVTGLFDLQAGASMPVAGLGFAGGAANLAGSGSDPGGGTSVNNTGGGGGGHGGAGSNGTGGTGGAAGDSLTNPRKLGSGGGGGRVGAGTGQPGGSGGGLFIVTAANMNINGYIDVSGADGGSGGGSGGGGAGGGVNLTASVFQGTGTVRARGGYGGSTLGGGGGGGRVSINVTGSGSICSLTFDVSGGTGTTSSGGGGTVSSTSTLLAPTGLTAFAATTSTLAWQWSPSNGALNYQLFSSTGGSGQSALLGASATYYVTTGLLANTTATFFVRALSCAGSADSAVAALSTLGVSPGPATAGVLGAFPSSATVAWTTLAGLSQPQSDEGYELDASTAADFSGLVLSSATPSAYASTLTVSGLWSNTTYYFRVASLNWAGALSSFTALGSTSTLALPVVSLPAPFLAVWDSSITVAWAALASSPPDASSKTAEGYVLQASTAPDFTGPIQSSATPSVAASTLTLTGLYMGTTWYLRVGSLNWSGAADFAVLQPLDVEVFPSSSGVSLGVLSAVYASTISISSIVVVNRGDLAVTFALYAATATPGGSPWTIATSSDVDQIVLQALWNSVAPDDSKFSASDDVLTSTVPSSGTVFAGDQTGVSVPPGQSRTLWFRFWRPTSTSALSKQNLLVNVRAQYP